MATLEERIQKLERKINCLEYAISLIDPKGYSAVSDVIGRVAQTLFFATQWADATYDSTVTEEERKKQINSFANRMDEGCYKEQVQHLVKDACEFADSKKYFDVDEYLKELNRKIYDYMKEPITH